MDHPLQTQCFDLECGDGLIFVFRKGEAVADQFWFFGFGGRGVGWSANQKINPSNPFPQHEPVVTLGKRGAIYVAAPGVERLSDIPRRSGHSSSLSTSPRGGRGPLG